MVGGYAFSRGGEHARVLDFFDGRGLELHAFEVWSAADVGGVFFPGVGLAFGDGEAAPALVSFENFRIAFGKHFGSDRLLNRLFDFALRGPEVGEVDGLAEMFAKSY